MSSESVEEEIKKSKKQYEVAVKKYVSTSRKQRNMPKRNSLNVDMQNWNMVIVPRSCKQERSG